MPTQVRVSIVKAHAREREILTQAAGRLQQIVNSPGFATRVLQHRWRSRPGFVGALGLDNAGVLRVLRTGREERRPVADFEWDIDVVVYSGRRGVVGYTSPDVLMIHMNRRAVDFSADGLGTILNNMAHEYCHKLGFDHDFDRTARRQFSVPYAVGDIVEELHGSR